MLIKRKIVGIIIISIGIFTPLISKYDSYKKEYIEKIEIEKYKNKEKNNYLMIIEIPKINLYKGIYRQEEKKNNISQNIKILEYSNLSSNTIFLAAHSGSSYNAFFNNIIDLYINDEIYVYYNNNKYTYLVSNKYYIEKTGYLEIENNLENKLILITCSLTYTNKQLIIISSLSKTEQL